VYAVCLHGNFSVSAVVVSHSQVVLNDTPTRVSASCPPGSVLTGGGFASTYGSYGSFPEGNAWSATYYISVGGSFTAQVYAVCAQANLSAAGQPNKNVIAPPYHNLASTIACGGTRLLTNGGFQTPITAPILGGSSPTDATATSWTVTLADPDGAGINAEIWAVCVSY
jgi:hypothetical protein